MEGFLSWREDGVMEYPKLRNIDAFPVETNGQKAIGLRDPAHFSDTIVIVSYPTFFIISLFDGKHSLLDIKTAYMKVFGEMLFTEQLEHIINYLDDHYLLESERYERYMKGVEEEFRNADVRPALFSGRSYASDPAALLQQVEGFFTASNGPGLPAGHGTGGALIKGIVAPHIDFQRGGSCYAWAYKELAESLRPELFVILGTVHAPVRQPFVLTRKDFDTPLGRVKTDKAFINEFQKKVGFDFFQDEIVHKTEHAIEFQIIFLRYLFQGGQPLTVVPILCGSFQEVIAQRETPLQIPHYGEFLQALKEMVKHYGCSVCFIASADLAHVGLRFGDLSPPSPASLSALASEDQKMLSYVARMDAEGFYQQVMEEGDKRKICGLPPIYVLLRVMDAKEGRLLNYQQALEPNGSSVVTFASMVFT